jgi:hypothetical protein
MKRRRLHVYLGRLFACEPMMVRGHRLAKVGRINWGCNIVCHLGAG